MNRNHCRSASRSAVLAIAISVASAFFAAPNSRADSYTGTLSTPEDTYSLVFKVLGSVNETVTAQSWSFGGGTNAAGTVIPAGGFDPFLGFFSGTGSSASLVTDAMGNPIASSDDLSNYSSFMGCPPAATVNLDGAICGNVTLSASLAPGTYTLLLSDAAYISNAANNGSGTIGDGFTDFTGGAFQTCNFDASGGYACQNDTANWAFDLTIGTSTTSGGGSSSVPEPSSLVLLAAVAVAMAFFARVAPRALCPRCCMGNAD
jgi:hypothetical protein